MITSLSELVAQAADTAQRWCLVYFASWVRHDCLLTLSEYRLTPFCLLYRWMVSIKMWRVAREPVSPRAYVYSVCRSNCVATDLRGCVRSSWANPRRRIVDHLPDSETEMIVASAPPRRVESSDPPAKNKCFVPSDDTDSETQRTTSRPL